MIESNGITKKRASFINTPRLIWPMSEGEDGGEGVREEMSQEEWNAFWKSLYRYQTPNALREEVFEQAEELWSDVSPRFKEGQQAYVVVQDGKFRANMAGHVLITAMANAVFRTTLNSIFNETILSQLSEELLAQVEERGHGQGQQLRPEHECPSCGAVFDPGMTVCPQCGEEL